MNTRQEHVVLSAFRFFLKTMSTAYGVLKRYSQVTTLCQFQYVSTVSLPLHYISFMSSVFRRFPFRFHSISLPIAFPPLPSPFSQRTHIHICMYVCISPNASDASALQTKLSDLMRQGIDVRQLGLELLPQTIVWCVHCSLSRNDISSSSSSLHGWLSYVASIQDC